MDVISALLLCLAWWMPLHFLPWVSWHSEALAFLTAMLLGWSAWLAATKEGWKAQVAVPVMVWPLTGLGMVVLVQSLGGQITYRGDALVFGIYLSAALICLTVGYAGGAAQNGRDRYLSLLAQALLAGAFVSALLSFVQVFELWENASWISLMPSGRRPGGNLGQPNHLGLLMLMGVVSLLFLYERRKINGVAAGLLLATLLTSLAMTESRAGALNFVLLSSWWLLHRKSIGSTVRPWFFGLAAAFYISALWYWPQILNWILVVSDEGATINTKPGSRLIIWPQLWGAVGLHPWFGWGLGATPKAHNAVASQFEVSEPFSYAHNILLDLALGIGLPLTCILVVLVALWFKRRLKAVRHLTQWYSMGLVLLLALHSLSEFTFAYSYFLVPVMLALGYFEAVSGFRAPIRVGAGVAGAFLLTVSVLMAWSVLEYVQIEEDFRIVRFEAMRIGQTPDDYQRPKVLVLTQLDALLSGGRIVPKPSMPSEEMELAKNVALRYPWTALQNRYALTLALNGQTEEALRQIKVMRAMHGEKDYAQIKANWETLAKEKYPQLRQLKLP